MGFQKWLLLINFQFILVQCLIPSLNVRRLDRELIARKRQDTLDMCKLFTSQNEKVKYYNGEYKLETNKNNDKDVKRNRRAKRNVGEINFAINPMLNEEDAKRVESIVEKLYDDLGEKGELVTYRHRSLSKTTVAITLEDMKNKTGRRFNFAPAELLGPLPEKPKHFKDDDVHVSSKARFKHGIVPYFIDSKTYDTHLSEIIMNAFDYFEKATCIRLQKLRERPTDVESLSNVDWLYITNPSGIRQCVHSNERRKTDGVQMVVFGYDCMALGDIAHEVMHVLGFSHEHIRSDRDQYITILWDNIKPGYKKYFTLNKIENEYEMENLPYDYASVLHYPSRAFSKNGQVTILTEPGIKIGQREGLSEIDVEKIGIIYSNECVKRNREYLLKTCPSVVKADLTSKKNITQKEIEDYFADRLWPYGIVNYKIRDKMEFSAEERENINAVIRHIEKETCIEFIDITTENINESHDDDLDSDFMSTTSIMHHNYEHGESDQPSHINTDNVVILHSKENRPYSDNVVQLTDTEMGYAENTVDDDGKYTNNNEKDIKSDSSENVINDEISETKRLKHRKHYNIKFAPSSPSNVTKTLSVSSPDGHKNLRTTGINKKQIVEAKSKTTTKQVKPRSKSVRRVATTQSANRRHANNILILSRSAAPGCECPKPGRTDGEKVLEINTDCFNSVNDLLHLFVHVLGLDHQHNMHDRDSYLHIVWDRLTADIKDEMQQVLHPAASVGFPYDYQSVMHYPWLQIKNGVTNIMYPIWNDGWAMGHWQGLSSVDVQKLNLLYFKQCVERQKHSED